MSGERPSDRAIAAAFWAFVGDSHNGTTSVIEQRARELDATAAPVVVGEDMVLVSRKETIELLAETIYDQWKDDPNYVPWRKGGNSDKQYAARDIARTVLSLATMTAALAGDHTIE